jgi:hypothetical protein
MKEHYLCILNPIDLLTVYELYLTNSRLITFGLEISETPVAHLVFVLIHSFLAKHMAGQLPDLTFTHTYMLNKQASYYERKYVVFLLCEFCTT